MNETKSNEKENVSRSTVVDESCYWQLTLEYLSGAHAGCAICIVDVYVQ